MHETFKNNVIYAVLHILRQFMKHVSNPPPFNRARICLRQTRIFMRHLEIIFEAKRIFSLILLLFHLLLVQISELYSSAFLIK